MEKILEINNSIIDYFDKNIPFSVIRAGNTEAYYIQEYLHNRNPPAEWDKWMFIIAGIFPDSTTYLKTVWMPTVLKCIENSDITMFVDISGQIQQDQSMQHYYNNKPHCFQDDCCVLDAGFLVGKNIHRVQCDIPWTTKLQGKKVLVISPFEKTIKKQWGNKNLIWGDDVDKMNGFELVEVIRSPFHPMVDGIEDISINSWDKVCDLYKTKIDKYDYDVLLIGAGAYAPVWADYAKQQGKIGITICGALQLLFGIKGPRWVDYPCYFPWKKMFNDNWIFPLHDDMPKNNNIMTNIENSYWR
jgi:hypothetical protein